MGEILFGVSDVDTLEIRLGGEIWFEDVQGEIIGYGGYCVEATNINMYGLRVKRGDRCIAMINNSPDHYQITALDSNGHIVFRHIVSPQGDWVSVYGIEGWHIMLVEVMQTTEAFFTKEGHPSTVVDIGCVMSQLGYLPKHVSKNGDHFVFALNV